MTANSLTEQPLDDVLQQAIRAHQSGLFEQAEDLYLAILQTQPYHAVANHNMGLLAGQVGQFAAALPYLHKALSVNPDEGQFWLSYADGLLKAGEAVQALDIIETAIGRGLDNEQSQALRQRIEHLIATTPTLEEQQQVAALYQAGDLPGLEQASCVLVEKYPQSDFAWSVLGTALQAQGKDAFDALQKTVALAPQDAVAHSNLGNAWQARGEHALAIACYQRALQLDQHLVEALCNMASALQALGQLTDAEHAFRQALALRPEYAKAHFNLGNTLRALGRLDEAVVSFEQAMALLPGDIDVLGNLGNALLDLGRSEAAATVYRQVLAINPALSIGHGNLGAALHNLAQFEAAEASFRTALALTPDDASVWNALGNCLESQQQLGEAVNCYRQAIRSQADFFAAHSNLGRALTSLKKFPEAVASFRSALAAQPDNLDRLHQLGYALQANQEFEEALLTHQQAIKIAPDDPFSHAALGNCLKQMRRFDAACAAYRQAIALAPELVSLQNDLALTLQASGDYTAAVAMYRHALTIAPDSVLVLCNLAVALDESGQSHAALECIERAIELEPDGGRTHFNLGNILRSMRRYDESLASYRRALALQPDFVGSYMNIGAVLSETGQIDEAVATYRKALALHPDDSDIYSNLLFCLSHVESLTATELVAEHFAFGEYFEAPLRIHHQPHLNTREPHRRLNIGFVSADFCNHAVSHFITPLLEQLSGMPELSLHAYYNNSRVDGATERIAGLIPHWNQVSHMTPVELAQRIRADGIDILIDLSGHTGRNCLLTFACKPAPLQISWIGYPLTTGLRTMDYYFGDPFMTPPEQFASHFTEKLILLPTVAPFLPSQDAQDILPAPALSNKFLTFGSFNRVNKINRDTIARWSKVLRAVPDAKMLMAGMQHGGPNPIFTAWFAEEGVSAERLQFVPRTDMAGFLALHHQVDICLDTAPYGGGTTTFHSLWMGVPTLTVAGSTVQSRSGTTILHHMDLAEFVARDDDELVSKAQAMASNPMLLTAYRYSTRHRLAQTALGRPDLIAEGVANSFRLIWQRWCEGLPPESFTAPLQNQLGKMRA